MKDNIVLVNEMEYNEALIDERDHGIAEIQQQIGEVNEIFQVLVRLVQINHMASRLYLSECSSSDRQK